MYTDDKLFDVYIDQGGMKCLLCYKRLVRSNFKNGNLLQLQESRAVRLQS